MTDKPTIELGGAAAWTDALQASHSYCCDVVKTRARNFYYGLKLVPEPKRSACYALYAWMREADDLADEAGDAAAKEKTLRAFWQQTEQAINPQLGELVDLPESLLWPAVRDMVLRYELPREYLSEMIDGQLLDQHKTRYKTFEELYEYCYKVASVVGLACVCIWGVDDFDKAKQLSEWRGIAFQLTNILRDVQEDAERDRVYMPADAYELFEINPTMFTLGDQSSALVGIRKIAEQAAEYYEKSAPLDAMVHPDGRPCLRAMTGIYRALLEKIRKHPEAVLSGQRVSVGKWKKLAIMLRAKWGLG
ncbi:squalene/phytoene synthase family protein [Planctomycetales bacterium ZRK34]|nr:squalene/phytoene synthase family protein [Planctomycetales bacterium ZRK34]